MNSRRAFDALLKGIESALQESLARQTKATQRSDLDAMEIELERQKNLVSARQQLEGLQTLWPDLVGERQRTAKPKRTKSRAKTETRPAKRKRLAKGLMTPQEAFELPILTALEAMGGSGEVKDVLARVEQLMADTLNEYDRGSQSSGQLRWSNNANWARQKMKERGLLADDSPRGVWKITKRGRAFLRERAEQRSQT